MKAPRCREVKPLHITQQLHAKIGVQMQGPLCRPCLCQSGTQQGGGRRRNAPTSLPACLPILPVPPQQKLGAQGHLHRSASWAQSKVEKDRGYLEGDREVTWHLSTPTTKTLVDTWPQLPPLYRATGQMPQDLGLQQAHLTLYMCKTPCMHTLPSPQVGPASSCSRLPSSFTLLDRALPLSYANISKWPTSDKAGYWE